MSDRDGGIGCIGVIGFCGGGGFVLLSAGKSAFARSVIKFGAGAVQIG